MNTLSKFLMGIDASLDETIDSSPEPLVAVSETKDEDFSEINENTFSEIFPDKLNNLSRRDEKGFLSKNAIKNEPENPRRERSEEKNPLNKPTIEKRAMTEIKTISKTTETDAEHIMCYNLT